MNTKELRVNKMHIVEFKLKAISVRINMHNVLQVIHYCILNNL